MPSYSLRARALAEGFGTFALVLVGCGAIVVGTVAPALLLRAFAGDVAGLGATGTDIHLGAALASRAP